MDEETLSEKKQIFNKTAARGIKSPVSSRISKNKSVEDKLNKINFDSKKNSIFSGN